MNKLISALIAAAMAVSASAAAAPLTAQQLSATNDFFTISPTTATVGPATEFIIDVSGADWFSIDFTEDGLVTVQWVQRGPLGHGADHNLSFSDINATISDIVGFNLISVSGITGLDQSDLGFGVDTLLMSIGSGTNWAEGAFFTAQIEFAPIPLPAALPLFLGGAGALSMFARRRRQAAR